MIRSACGVVEERMGGVGVFSLYDGWCFGWLEVEVMPEDGSTEVTLVRWFYGGVVMSVGRRFY